MRNTARVWSFFSGAGFLDLGFSETGYDVVFVNEIHKPFMKIYRESRKALKHNVPELGHHECDISEVIIGRNKKSLTANIKKMQRDGIVGFIGGPPCPDFSVGGKNMGRHGENGKLTHTYFSAIMTYQPDFFVFENVKGLWKTRRHRVFYDEMKRYVGRNYEVTDKLINCVEFGAPQDRERIIMIGFNRQFLNEQGLEVRDKGKMVLDFPWDEFALYSQPQVFDAPWPQMTPFKQDSTTMCPNNIPKELTVEWWFKRNDVYNHVNTDMCFVPRAGLSKFLSVAEGDVRFKSYKRLHRWRYSPTACYGNNEVHLHPYKARRLTVAEVLAIQSLPKEFVIPTDISLSDAFKAVGNGVPFLAAKSIAKSIFSFLRLEA